MSWLESAVLMISLGFSVSFLVTFIIDNGIAVVKSLSDIFAPVCCNGPPAELCGNRSLALALH